MHQPAWSARSALGALDDADGEKKKALVAKVTDACVKSALTRSVKVPSFGVHAPAIPQKNACHCQSSATSCLRSARLEPSQ